MSQLTIRDSSNYEVTSSDNELKHEDVKSNKFNSNLYTRKMLLSKDQIDSRIVDIYRIRKTHQLSQKLPETSRWKNLTAQQILLPIEK